MSKMISKAIVGGIGCIVIGAVCIVLKTAVPLWGLFLIVLVVSEID